MYKYKYEVTVNFLHKPDHKTTVSAINEYQALCIAVAEPNYPTNTMYSNASKVKLITDDIKE